MKLIRASVLLLALATFALGGEMGNGVVSQPPPSSTTSSSAPDTAALDGEMGNGVTVTTATIIVSLLQTLLSLP